MINPAYKISTIVLACLLLIVLSSGSVYHFLKLKEQKREISAEWELKITETNREKEKAEEALVTKYRNMPTDSINSTFNELFGQTGDYESKLRKLCEDNDYYKRFDFESDSSQFNSRQEGQGGLPIVLCGGLREEKHKDCVNKLKVNQEFTKSELEYMEDFVK